MRTLKVVVLSLVAIVTLGAVMSPNAKGEVLYREIFPTVSTANTPIETVGWNLHYDASAEEYDSSSTGGGYGAWNVSAAAAPGLPINLAGVKSNPHISDQEVGFLFFNKDGDTDTHNLLAWTEEVMVANVDKAGLSEASFYVGNNDTTPMRLALKIADSWFVTSDTFAYVSSNGMPGGAKWTVSDFASANWNALTFIPGTELSRSSTLTSLPEGLVQAAGIYTDDMVTNLTSHRVDTFEIQGTAVPEPGTLVLFLGIALGVSGVCRFRFSH